VASCRSRPARPTKASARDKLKAGKVQILSVARHELQTPANLWGLSAIVKHGLIYRSCQEAYQTERRFARIEGMERRLAAMIDRHRLATAVKPADGK
jgi:hypothetical protein